MSYPSANRNETLELVSQTAIRRKPFCFNYHSLIFQMK
ncbi:hypothetical protein LEP1GSC075_0634 [Leptospira interrogans str. Kito]|nr:hypothetical protein LEP1GSC075_0634 [Leptospira interrogans str. Kito]